MNLIKSNCTDRSSVKLNSYNFKFKDIDLILPRYIESSIENNYYFLFRPMNIIRMNQLSNRSLQSFLMDSVIELDYFNDEIIPEYPIIIENDKRIVGDDRNFYLLDYFIPSKSLCIELDSSYHNSRKYLDDMKDEYLSKLGIEVMRIRNLNSSDIKIIKSKLSSMKDNPFTISYDNLIESSKLFSQLPKVTGESRNYFLKSKPELEGLHIKNKWISIISKLSDTIMPNLLDNINNSTKATYEVELDEIYKIVPSTRKQSYRYRPLIYYLNELGIDLIINNSRRKSSGK